MKTSPHEIPPASSVLITGAAGRVGRNLSRLLEEQKRYRLRLTDIAEGTIDGRPVEKLDLMDFEKVIQNVQAVDAIVHCAIASYPSTATDANEVTLRDYHNRMLEVNIKGTYHLYEAARINRIPRVVYISSLTVALGHGCNSDLREDLSPKPENLYACTKLFGENLAEFFSRTHAISSVVLRLGQPFPLGLPHEKSWKNDPHARAHFATHGDIMHAVDCALQATQVRFGIYNVVSLNDCNRVSCSHGREIGFQPREHWADFDTDTTALAMK